MVEYFPQKETFNFIVNLGIVLNKNGEVLIVKRRHPEETKTGKKLLWAFPGGKQEKGESREESVAKEILLETGYKVKPTRQIHLRVHPDTNVLLIYHLCELEKEESIAEIQEKDEIEEVRWVKPQELKDYFTTDIDPEVKKILGI
jgi:mutator protein MutT